MIEGKLSQLERELRALVDEIALLRKEKDGLKAEQKQMLAQLSQARRKLKLLDEASPRFASIRLENERLKRERTKIQDEAQRLLDYVQKLREHAKK